MQLPSSSEVQLLNSTFPIKSKNVGDITVKSKSYDIDLYVAVSTRPFGYYSSTLASAFPDSLSFFDNRPIRGGIYINAQKVPSEPQNETSINRKFFTTCLHEICHILGINRDLYPYWLNRKTGNSWGSKIPMTTIEKDGKIFTLLQTPQCVKYATKRWNRTEFIDGVPMGVELEDGGGLGTEKSHPEARVFFNELMVGLSIQPAKISDLTLAMLEDTGWYDCNYDMAELLAWGDGDSINGTKLPNFPVDPPYTAFPKNYLCNENESNDDKCSYDYTYIGECSSSMYYDCPGYTTDEKNYCKAMNFYNPLNFSKRGVYSIVDFTIFPVMSRNCKDVNSNIVYEGETYGKDSFCFMKNNITPMCYKTEIENETNLFVTIGNVTKQCNYENEVLNFDNFNITCPDPIKLIRMRAFQNSSVYRPPLGKTHYNYHYLCNCFCLLLFSMFMVYLKRRKPSKI
ncbi:GP63-like [Trichomonas vaginalis G3]|uniref:GP63-like n=1 Tax=Trichomonas vaginalis (strain ATCC PRA-98 / G3) TaxID=412133 RepID=A2G491_TRIV3|nr:regulation of choline O-acetyltransferase protein [Trichomonas vaginalis G3]EAX88019.1 GP63-like [Trichomonas vaginalis G3]KAI5551538.1 regulation of choline O-acetyltransferase protein [Trichomonas vaginalis G3]|eukprot:XP_001300949.1 GP63-like [Trichomonas vaginalis G3]